MSPRPGACGLVEMDWWRGQRAEVADGAWSKGLGGPGVVVRGDADEGGGVVLEGRAGA